MDQQLNEKLQSVLSNPDSLRSILQIASSLGLGGTAVPAAATEQEEIQREESEKDDRATDNRTSEEKESDMGEKTAAAPLLGSIQPASVIPQKGMTDDRINLLLSLRPFLEPRKRQKVDSLVKALGYARVINQYKDSDIIQKLGLK